MNRTDLSKRDRRMYNKLHVKIRDAMLEQEPNRTNDVFMRCSELAQEIIGKIWTEYKSRQDRGLWVHRMIQSNEIWNI